MRFMTRRAMTLTIAATALTTLGVGLAASPASAATDRAHKPSHGLGTLYLKQTERQAIDLGATGTSIGDVVSGSGTVSSTSGGTAIGSFDYRAETLAVNMPGGTESRNSTLWVSLDGGRIAATALISVQSGTRPTASQEYIVLGGTGKYRGVRGTMTFTPLSADDYKVAFRLVS